MVGSCEAAYMTQAASVPVGIFYFCHWHSGLLCSMEAVLSRRTRRSSGRGNPLASRDRQLDEGCDECKFALILE